MDAAKSKIAAIDKEVASLRRRRALGGGRRWPPMIQVLSAEAVYARLYRELGTARAAYEAARAQLDAQINEQLAKVKRQPAARVGIPRLGPADRAGVSRKMMIALCVALGLLAGILARRAGR